MEWWSNAAVEHWRDEFISLLRHSITPTLQFSITPALSSSNTHPALALLEERPQRRQIILPGLQRDCVNIISPERARKLCSLFIDQIRETLPRPAIRCVDLDLISGLGIFQSNDADIRQRLFAFIVDVDRNEIMSPPAYRQRPRKIRHLKIRNEKDHRAARDDFVQIIERQCRFCPASLRFKKQNLADQPQGVRPALLWRNKKFNAICEENEAHLVVIPDCAEGEQTGDFRGQLALGLGYASEISRGAHIDNKHDSKLTFLGKFFYKRGAHPCCHVPIDGAYFIARLILAHIFKIHPTPFKHAVVVPGEGGLDQTACFDFQRPNFLENLGRFHRLRAPVVLQKS